MSKNNFIRIHRPFIIAINKIESFTNGAIEIAKQELPVSRMYRHEVDKVFECLNDGSLNLFPDIPF